MQSTDLGPRAPRLIAAVLTPAPASAGAETCFDAPASTMFSSEAATVAGAVAERRREFATVRHCARRALRQIGVPAAPIMRDRDGVPSWPVGVVGSMTHCAGYRAAAVAPAADLRSLGIDAEAHAPVPDDALDLIARAEERAQLLALAETDPSLHWDRILFCAKEAVYKAWFPLTRRWLDFPDVSTELQADGTFSAQLCLHGSPPAGAEVDAFSGRWIVGRGLIVAATSVGRSSSS